MNLSIPGRKLKTNLPISAALGPGLRKATQIIVFGISKYEWEPWTPESREVRLDGKRRPWDRDRSRMVRVLKKALGRARGSDTTDSEVDST